MGRTGEREGLGDFGGDLVGVDAFHPGGVDGGSDVEVGVAAADGRVCIA